MKLETTTIYTKVAVSSQRRLESPLDVLDQRDKVPAPMKPQRSVYMSRECRSNHLFAARSTERSLQTTRMPTFVKIGTSRAAKRHHSPFLVLLLR